MGNSESGGSLIAGDDVAADERRIEEAEIERLRRTVEAQTTELRALRERVRHAQHREANLQAAQVRVATLSHMVASCHAAFKKSGWLPRTFGGQSPLDPWVRLINKAGLFDRQWYTEQNKDVATAGVDPLAHYLLYGGYEGRTPNPYFDSGWYLRTYADVVASGQNPLVHYIVYGAAEGRGCGPAFDPRAYLDANPDVAAARMNPLTHFLRHGRKEGRRLRHRDVARPEAPAWSAFEKLVRSARRRRAASAAADKPFIDIIVPVYRGYGDTLACLYSVLAAAVSRPFELIVIDDVSPEPELSAALRRLADMGLITLLRNRTNLGFVGTVNRGMRRHPGRDVVLLNSDTEVYNNWLDRLATQAHSQGVGTVTPLSNNATICSYPRTNRDNPALLEIPYPEIDALAAKANKGKCVEVPTGVGFCMYIRRGALDEVGYFDEEAFGKGYGEENDFCMRVADKAWRNVLALDVFVRHTGETSFAGTASESQKRGLEIIKKKHPTYLRLVHEHIRSDPAADARRRLDLARLRKRIGEGPTIACILHTWGGGILRHIQDESKRQRRAGFAQVVLSPSGGFVTKADVNAVTPIDLPNLSGLEFAGDARPLLDVLEQLNVQAIEVHSLVGWPPAMLEALPRLARQLGASLKIVLHDYAPLCPQINLMNGADIYCGERGEKQCRSCLKSKPEPPALIHGPAPFDGGIEIHRWRAAYHRLLRSASELSAPSDDTARRYRRYFPDLEINVSPHEEEIEAPAHPLAIPYTGSGNLRVILIGAIGPHKGSHVLKACAEDAAARRLPLEFIVVGYTNKDAELIKLRNVRITGRYDEADLFGLLEQQQGHVAFLPSVWPETFSYTLTAAVAAGFPTVIFDLGAPAERLAGVDNALLLPLELAARPKELNDRILTFARDRAAARPEVGHGSGSGSALAPSQMRLSDKR